MSMVLRCAVCDNTPDTAERVKNRLEKIFADKNVGYEIVTYTDSRQMLFELYGNKYFDLIILDIKMPYVSGLKIAAFAKQNLSGSLVIFLTEHIEYAHKGYELGVFRYILKSEVDACFERAICDALKSIDLYSKCSYYIEKHNLCGKMPYKDILYIKKSGKNSVIHSLTFNPVSLRKPLATIYSELASDDFIYINRGCIANMANVKFVSKYEWVCSNGESIPISSASYSKIKQQIMEFWGLANI